VRIAIDAVRLSHAAWADAWREGAAIRRKTGADAGPRAAAEEMLTKPNGISLALV
jgi:hypothetical protein